MANPKEPYARHLEGGYVKSMKKTPLTQRGRAADDKAPSPRGAAGITRGRSHANVGSSDGSKTPPLTRRGRAEDVDVQSRDTADSTCGL